MWTLVGSGHKTFEQSGQPMGKTLPKGAEWIKDSVALVQPENNLVKTANGLEVSFIELFCFSILYNLYSKNTSISPVLMSLKIKVLK